MIIASDLKENSLACDLCKSRKTLYIKELDDDDIMVDAWWRCLNCKKEYGAKLNFYKTQDGEMKIKTEISWKREIKE